MTTPEHNGQTWLICGGRDFTDVALFNSTMRRLLRERGRPKGIIHGAARGADAMAENWAASLGIARRRFPAQWDKHGRAAGPIRNQAMIDKGNPSLGIAFPGGRGTADMTRRAREAGAAVLEVREQPATA